MVGSRIVGVVCIAACSGSDAPAPSVAVSRGSAKVAAPASADAATAPSDADPSCRAMASCNNHPPGPADLVACDRRSGPTIERQGRAPDVLWNAGSGSLGQACWIDNSVHVTVHHPERPEGRGDIVVYDLELRAGALVEVNSFVDSGD